MGSEPGDAQFLAGRTSQRHPVLRVDGYLASRDGAEQLDVVDTVEDLTITAGPETRLLSSSVAAGSVLPAETSTTSVV